MSIELIGILGFLAAQIPAVLSSDKILRIFGLIGFFVGYILIFKYMQAAHDVRIVNRELGVQLESSDLFWSQDVALKVAEIKLTIK